MSETELEATLAGTQDGVEPVMTGQELAGQWTGQELAGSLAGLASSVATGPTAGPRSASSPPQPFVYSESGSEACQAAAKQQPGQSWSFGVQQRAADVGGRWNLAGVTGQGSASTVRRPLIRCGLRSRCPYPAGSHRRCLQRQVT